MPNNLLPFVSFMRADEEVDVWSPLMFLLVVVIYQFKRRRSRRERTSDCYMEVKLVLTEFFML